MVCEAWLQSWLPEVCQVQGLPAGRGLALLLQSPVATQRREGLQHRR